MGRGVGEGLGEVEGMKWRKEEGSGRGRWRSGIVVERMSGEGACILLVDYENHTPLVLLVLVTITSSEGCSSNLCTPSGMYGPYSPQSPTLKLTYNSFM